MSEQGGQTPQSIPSDAELIDDLRSFVVLEEHDGIAAASILSLFRMRGVYDHEFVEVQWGGLRSVIAAEKRKQGATWLGSWLHAFRVAGFGRELGAVAVNGDTFCVLVGRTLYGDERAAAELRTRGWVVNTHVPDHP